jgi:hypothetical protein
MPYLSDAERQRQKWMTFKEAISHIRSAEKCDENTALQQLRHALAEGAVESTWALSEAALGASIVHRVVGMPERQHFWLSVLINLAAGTIINSYISK